MTASSPTDLLLGVDVGSSSSKGVLVRPDGTLVATDTLHESLLIAVKRKPSLVSSLATFTFSMLFGAPSRTR